MNLRGMIGGILLVAMTVGMADAQPASTAAALSPEQRAAVDQAIHDYILSHPEIVVEAVEAAKQKEEQAKEARTQQVLAERAAEIVADPASPVGGNPKGDVTIVEFFDYSCPYCKEVEPSLEALLKQDPKLRIEYKEFPVLGPGSVYAARVALAAQKQGKYIAFHTAMMATKGDITDDVVLRVARLAGLDLDRVKRDMMAPDIDAVIHHNYELAQALAIDGTPGFVIGKEVADGAPDIDTLTRMVADARAAE